MKKIKVFFTILLSTLSFTMYGQLTIEDCHEKARQNFPQIKQYDLIGQSKNYNLSNASRGYLPQFSISAKATYQTEVTKIPITLPEVNIPTINKNQYQAIAEVNQTIWDGGAIKSQKDRIHADYEVEKNQYEVEMYALYERINDIFFGILLFDEQLLLNDIYATELESNYEKVSGSILNGVANQADLDAVSVEILNTSQRKIELESTREAYSNMLAYFIGEAPGKSIRIVKPQIDSQFGIPVPATEGNNAWILRPEIAFYDANIKQLESQRKNITANNMPKFSAFIQGGYGNPGLNMFEEGFRTYAIGGVKLSWNFGGLYTRKNDLRKIENNISKIRIQQDIFSFNTHLKTIQQQTEIDKYFKIIRDDDQIIQLRENIKKASEAKVDNGTLSVNDLVRDISSEQTARRNKALHEIEMIKSIYQLKNTLNR